MIKPIAVYLPQFHPIRENDEWWGKGFTEWTNVTKAKPLFKDHYQPQLPAELGFYDLRLEEARLAQEALAKEYGIYGFCYYHYWFNGKRILHEPLDRKLKNAKENLPFMICWANENWTKVWDGGEKNILLEQQYSVEDDREHIRHLIPYFKDLRYIRYEGKPIVVIYKSTLLPNPRSTINIWREEALKENLELFICRMDAHGYSGDSFLAAGFDKSIDFQPFGNYYLDFMYKHQANGQSISNKIYNKFLSIIMSGESFKKRMQLKNNLYSYQDYVNFIIQQNRLSDNCFPGITPGWDNTSRRKENYFILHNSTPELFGKWLSSINNHYNKKDTFLFINAWNEWAEGNHLEPCQKWGRAYLEKIKEIIK